MAIPTIVSLRPGASFTPAAADSFARAEDDAGRRIDVNSSYRDYNTQLGMYNAWRRYVLSGYKASLKPPHSQAIHPDVSKHCQGLALDSDDWTRPGFNAFMAEHGWIRTAASDPTERHHFEYQAARDKHRGRTAPAGGKGTLLAADATPAAEKDYDMTLYYRPTENSAPINGNSRIWAGERGLNGLGYSDVWAVNDIGEGRRLPWKTWADMKAEAARRGIKLIVIACTGNDLEAIIYGPRELAGWR
jgi:hypothetical protein